MNGGTRMSTYALIPGAGCSPWYWHLLEADLRGRGHDVLPIDLPGEDDAAGLDEYAETVAAAIGDRDDDVIVVAHSFGGFTAPLVWSGDCRRDRSFWPCGDCHPEAAEATQTAVPPPRPLPESSRPGRRPAAHREPGGRIPRLRA